jgi:hypothetical protein
MTTTAHTSTVDEQRAYERPEKGQPENLRDYLWERRQQEFAQSFWAPRHGV